ncbi:MAG: Rieske 2Fe-2S domain-containing protein [bacterium]|nr:Rieske 2Fe-2S domain-containing protein [bacterium]
MSLFTRLFGIPKTKPPVEDSAWRYANGVVHLDLSKTPELNSDGGAVRLEGEFLPMRVLVLRGADGQFHAYRNHCTHGGRRLDPVECEDLVQCCSLGKSTFDYDGNALHGPGKHPLTPLPVELEGHILTVLVSERH